MHCHARKRVVLDHLSPPRRADTTADMHIVGRRARTSTAQNRMSVCAREVDMHWHCELYTVCS
jgi:hypothetical protein